MATIDIGACLQLHAADDIAVLTFPMPISQAEELVRRRLHIGQTLEQIMTDENQTEDARAMACRLLARLRYLPAIQSNIRVLHDRYLRYLHDPFYESTKQPTGAFVEGLGLYGDAAIPELVQTVIDDWFRKAPFGMAQIKPAAALLQARLGQVRNAHNRQWIVDYIDTLKHYYKYRNVQ